MLSNIYTTKEWAGFMKIILPHSYTLSVQHYFSTVFAPDLLAIFSRALSVESSQLGAGVRWIISVSVLLTNSYNPTMPTFQIDDQNMDHKKIQSPAENLPVFIIR